MAIPLDAREREALCDRAAELGPDAPTLCEGWTTADLIAHLLVRERKPAAMPGILVGGRLGEITVKAMESVKAGGYDSAIARLRTPPLFPGRTPGVRTLLNLTEYFVHHEDIRRANPPGTPRTDIPDVVDKLWSLQRRSARLLLRGVKGIGVELARPDGDTVTARKGSPAARITGEPGEIVLYLFGRGAAAEVEITGDPDAVARLASARFGF